MKSISSIAIAILFLMIAGCSKHVAKTGKSLVIYPAPPDTARIQYLTTISNSLDIIGKRKGIQKTVLGEDPGMPVGKPYGIATNKGKIFICDATIKGIDIIDLEKRNFEQFLPGGKGQLKLPINCFIDSSGFLFVTDAGRKDVVVFDDQLNYVTAIGRPDTSEDYKPLDVCAAGQKIWVTNSPMHQVLIFQKEIVELAKYVSGDKTFVNQKVSYKLVSTLPGDNADEESKLFNPINISYQNGLVYITDFGDFKIKIYSEDGKYIRSVGQYGKGIGQFVRPKGIAIDKEDNLYVVDAGFENVQIFNPEGKLLMFFGGPYKGPGDMWLPAKVHIDYDNTAYFKKWVDPEYELSYLIYVSNQYGPDKVNVYGAVKPKYPAK